MIAKENNYETSEITPIRESSKEVKELKKTPVTGTDRPCDM